MGLVQGAQRRQGVVRPQRRGGQGQYLASDRRHGSPWKPLSGAVNRGSACRAGATCLTFNPLGRGRGAGIGSGGRRGHGYGYRYGDARTKTEKTKESGRE
ncbi:hypothetical protein GCM10023257_04850 [Streptomyces hyderabadensis]|uniref:Uncharacterized protein n=1 Tax=Streptomyces hyderabadensis TaxID=598549 RepID=A0ABP9HIS6_9ACTN